MAWWIGLADKTVARVKAQGLWNVEKNDYGQDWGLISAAARKRDNFICQHCGLAGRGFFAGHGRRPST